MHLEQMSKADMLITRDGKLFALSYWMSQGCNYQLSNILIFIDLAELQLFIMKTAARQTSTFSFLKLDILPSRILGYVAVQISHLEHGGLWFSQFIERWLPSGHLYDGAAKGPDVCWFAVSPWALVYNFRSHVLQCA